MQALQNITPQTLTQATSSGNLVKTLLMPNTTNTTHQTSSTLSSIEKTRVDRLFSRLGVIYGHLWQSQYKQAGFLTLAKTEWAITLRGVDNNSVRLAIEECQKRIEMPPTLPLFFQLCKNFQTNNKPTVPKKFNDTEKSTPEVAQKFIQKIREELAKQGARI